MAQNPLKNGYFCKNPYLASTIVAVTIFTCRVYQAFLREHMLPLIQKMLKEQPNPASGRSGGC